MSEHLEQHDQTAPQLAFNKTLLHLLSGSPFSVSARKEVIALADLGLGTADGTHCDAVVSLPQTPIVLIEHDHPEVLNRDVVSDSTDLLSGNQRVSVLIIDSKQLKAIEHDIVRFLAGTVAMAHCHKKDPRNLKKKTWHTVIDVLLSTPGLEKAIAKHVFQQSKTDKLIHKNLQLLCANRASISRISEYRNSIEQSQAA